jgi:6-pyruvoyltetrahydropterin/6-carboxytetrahydropterin synthase
MKASVCKEFHFEAAHQLPNHEGKCRHLHGHSYKLFVFIQGNITPADGSSSEGMVVDFAEVKNTVNVCIIDRLDHQYLNNIKGLEIPTAENIAAWIFRALCLEWYGCDPRAVEHSVPEMHPRLYAIMLKETESSFVQITLEDFGNPILPPGVGG